MVKLFRESACIKDKVGKNDVSVSGSFTSALSSFIGTAWNASLGIAVTDTSRHLAKKNGLLSKAYFREYALAANVPVTLEMGFQDVGNFYYSNGIQYHGGSPSCS